jgi:acyl carrier protein
MGRISLLQLPFLTSAASLPSSTPSKDTEELEFVKHRLLEEILAPLLPHCDIDLHTPLMAQGLTSHGIARVASGIYKVFGVEIEKTMVFDYPTVQQLAAQLCKLANGCGTINEGELPLSPTTMAAGDVAITGMACRLPNGIEGSDSLWDAISTGRCMIRKVNFISVLTLCFASQ